MWYNSSIIAPFVQITTSYSTYKDGKWSGNFAKIVKAAEHTGIGVTSWDSTCEKLTVCYMIINALLDMRNFSVFYQDDNKNILEVRKVDSTEW